MGSFETPSRDVLGSEQFLLSIDEVSFFFDEVLLGMFAARVKFSERLMFGHVVLEVTTQVDVEEVTQVGDMVPRPSAHFGEPSVELVNPVNPDHVIHTSQFFEMLT